MFDNKDYSFGRSGTAPTSQQNAKTSVHMRSRPKTRAGVSNDGGASDLADLNLALKMDNQLNMKDDDDAFENYQSAIDSWETGLLSRHASRTTSNTGSRKSGTKGSGPSPRNNTAAYKSSDPVSAAYFSQFRPSSRSTQSASSGTNSPRSRFKQNSSARADEVKAVYGLGNRDAQTGGSAQSGRRKPRQSGPDVDRGSSGSGDRSGNAPASRPSASAGLEREREREARGNPRPTSGAARKKAGHYIEPGSPTRSTYQKKPSIVSSTKGSSFKRQHRIVSNPATGNTTPEYNPDSEDVPQQPSPSSKKVPDATTSDRPESRKLYLGGGVGGSSDVVLGPSTSGHKQELTLKVPRSAGSKKMTDGASTTADPLLHGEEEEGRIRASSFSGMCSPAPWHGDNLDDRPPSRQRSAFPTHLGEALDLKRRNANAPNTRNTDAFSKESPSPNELHPQHPQQHTAPTQIPGPTLSRPPSRQRLNAQHLWSGKPDSELRPPTPDYSSDGGECSDRGSQEFDVSPVLTAYQSAASFELQDDPSADKIVVNMTSRSPSPQIALGPMYDPLADGFSQLDSRGSTAPPFKVRYNQSVASSSLSRQKPSSAAAKGSVYLRMPSGGKEVDFNECEVVEDLTEYPPPTRGTSRKGSSNAVIGSSSPCISASCHSSPSPEQIIESYAAWHSDSSSPSSQLTRSKSTTGKKNDEARWPLGKSSSQASVFARPFSPANPRIGLSTTEGRNRAFVSNGGEVGGSQSPSGSPVPTRFRNRNLASNLDDVSFADEELTVMTNCSEGDLEQGNDVNMFGEQLSQSIMLESSLGQDFLNLFAPSD